MLFVGRCYIATIGFQSLNSHSAAKVTLCCSAIATSKNLSGCCSENSTIPDPSDIAGVMATNLSSIFAVKFNQSPKTLE